MNLKTKSLKNIPSVNLLLSEPEINTYIKKVGKELVLLSIRKVLSDIRKEKSEIEYLTDISTIKYKIFEEITKYKKKSLNKVINATGIVIHTNLGRAPLGEDILNESSESLKEYNNLEFDLQKGTRGDRNQHAAEIIKLLTGAEDVLIVNNNAAAVMLILHVIAKNRQVVVSRGELIEIGGSFRIPEIMEASGCQMVEVGTTNKTKINDFERAISKETAILFKAHKSNYVIKGFTDEVKLEELIQIGKKFKKPVLFDMGSGLIKKTNHPILQNEPTVHDAISKGVDMICFSGDKLLGGPQAGIICGKKKWIEKLKKDPMLRALRVGKETLALLETTCMCFLNENELCKKNFIYKVFNRKTEEIEFCANLLKNELKKHKVESDVIKSIGHCGGGTLPEEEIKSFAVKIILSGSSQDKIRYAEKMYTGLMLISTPVLAILKKGTICFDILTLFEKDISILAKSILQVDKALTAI
jgi:L-seryl-tRNA(Ser) seleniumtransferase